MKKHFFLLLFATLCFAAFSQENDQIMRVSARIGLNGSNVLLPRSMDNNMLAVPETFFPTTISSGNFSLSHSLKIGASAGLVFDFKLKDKLSLQTGIFYSLQRLGQVHSAVFNDNTDTHFSITTENTVKMHRLKVPLMVNYRFSQNSNSFIIGAGVFADCALGGDIAYDASAVVTSSTGAIQKYTASGNFDPFQKDMKHLYYNIVNDDYINKYSLYNGNIYNRFDFGIVAELGYQIHNFYVGLHAEFGLLNMINEQFSGDNVREHNANFQLQLGYKIN